MSGVMPEGHVSKDRPTSHCQDRRGHAYNCAVSVFTVSLMREGATHRISSSLQPSPLLPSCSTNLDPCSILHPSNKLLDPIALLPRNGIRNRFSPLSTPQARKHDFNLPTPNPTRHAQRLSILGAKHPTPRSHGRRWKL
jgi:hypothetical protein